MKYFLARLAYKISGEFEKVCLFCIMFSDFELVRKAVDRVETNFQLKMP